jgi:hypothetical protein
VRLRAHGPCQVFVGENLAGAGADADAARVRALAAYKDFRILWKDAETDISIYKQATAE